MAGLHIGFAMASKRLTPEVPLAVLIAAEELLDLLCLVFLPTGMEKNGLNPLTHNLPMALLWGILAGAICFFLLKKMAHIYYHRTSALQPLGSGFDNLANVLYLSKSSQKWNTALVHRYAADKTGAF